MQVQVAWIVSFDRRYGQFPLKYQLQRICVARVAQPVAVGAADGRNTFYYFQLCIGAYFRLTVNMIK
jgi:hypothetical protein